MRISFFWVLLLFVVATVHAQTLIPRNSHFKSKIGYSNNISLSGDSKHWYFLEIANKIGGYEKLSAPIDFLVRYNAKAKSFTRFRPDFGKRKKISYTYDNWYQNDLLHLLVKSREVKGKGYEMLVMAFDFQGKATKEIQIAYTTDKEKFNELKFSKSINDDLFCLYSNKSLSLYNTELQKLYTYQIHYDEILSLEVLANQSIVIAGVKDEKFFLSLYNKNGLSKEIPVTLDLNDLEAYDFNLKTDGNYIHLFVLSGKRKTNKAFGKRIDYLKLSNQDLSLSNSQVVTLNKEITDEFNLIGEKGMVPWLSLVDITFINETIVLTLNQSYEVTFNNSSGVTVTTDGSESFILIGIDQNGDVFQRLFYRNTVLANLKTKSYLHLPKIWSFKDQFYLSYYKPKDAYVGTPSYFLNIQKIDNKLETSTSKVFSQKTISLYPDFTKLLELSENKFFLPAMKEGKLGAYELRL